MEIENNQTGYKVLTTVVKYAVTFSILPKIWEILISVNIEFNKNIITSNGVIIYCGAKNAQQTFFEIMNFYPNIWHDSGKNVKKKQH